METLIKDLLAYARVGTRGRETSRRPTPARRSRQALDNLHESIQETGAEITHGELPTVRADPSQLAQLFQNLLGNALKFRSEAPPKIHVDARREGDCWQFSVRDNGIGIDPKFQDDIFEVFRRLHTHKAVRRHGHRPGNLQENRGPPRRANLGGIGARQRHHGFFHVPCMRRCAFADRWE